jgi:hypothetical protein
MDLFRCLTAFWAKDGPTLRNQPIGAAKAESEKKEPFLPDSSHRNDGTAFGDRARDAEL